MPRYVFSKGRVTVKDGVYLPVLRDEKPSRRGVLIMAQPHVQKELEESTQEGGESHDQ